MSGYNYQEKTGCGGCFKQTAYDNLEQTASGDCLPPCLDRWNTERTPKDKWMYDVWVLGKKSFPFQPIKQVSLGQMTCNK